MKRIILLLFFFTLMGCNKETYDNTATYYIQYTNESFPNQMIDVLCEMNYTAKALVDYNLYGPITDATHNILDIAVEKYSSSDTADLFFNKIVNWKINLNDREIIEGKIIHDYEVTLHNLIIVKFFSVDTLNNGK